MVNFPLATSSQDTSLKIEVSELQLTDLVAPPTSHLESLTEADGEIVRLEELTYTNDISLKLAVFEMHTQTGTNFFVRYKKKYGEVLEINPADQSVVVGFTDNTEKNISINSSLLYVEQEDWLTALDEF